LAYKLLYTGLQSVILRTFSMDNLFRWETVMMEKIDFINTIGKKCLILCTYVVHAVHQFYMIYFNLGSRYHRFRLLSCPSVYIRFIRKKHR